MVTFGSAYMAAVALGALVSAGLTGLALRNREYTESKALAVLTAGITIWTGGELAGLLATSREWTVRWVQVHWLGVAIVPTALFVFVLVYTGHARRLTRRRLAILSVVPVVVTCLVVTGRAHDLIWTSIEPSTATPIGFVFENGVAFYAYAAYGYGLLAIATVALASFIVRSTDLYRGQATLLMVATLAPWAGNVGYVIGDSVVNLTSIGFTIGAAALGVAVLRYRLTDIVPIARNTIVEHINDGVIVLDRQGRVVDVNPQAEPYLREAGADSAIGRRATAVLPDPIADWLGTKHFEEQADGSGVGQDVDADRSSTAVSHSDGDGADERAPAGETEPSSDDRTAATTVRLGRGGNPQHLAVETTALTDADRRIGKLLIIRDVTEQRRYERELERQNERLDRFASVVSHDLRNPLNVADGYTSILAERYDDPAVDEIDTSLDRMEAIIEDVLALTHHRDGVSEPERIDLAALVEDAWNGVETADATLTVETADHAVLADRSRLAQALENLFRNSVEHGGSDVTVTVGTIHEGDTPETTTGFFVADDGRGIPEDDREAILEPGYTTDPGGTGLGLDIVSQIVEAHGWSFAVTESADGGARFEIHYDGQRSCDGAGSTTAERAADGAKESNRAAAADPECDCPT